MHSARWSPPTPRPIRWISCAPSSRRRARPSCRPKPSLDEAVALTAIFPTVVAATWRRSQGHEIVKPRSDLGHAANLLWMMDGKEPSVDRTRWLGDVPRAPGRPRPERIDVHRSSDRLDGKRPRLMRGRCHWRAEKARRTAARHSQLGRCSTRIGLPAELAEKVADRCSCPATSGSPVSRHTACVQDIRSSREDSQRVGGDGRSRAAPQSGAHRGGGSAHPP